MATEVTMVLKAGVDMANFLIVDVREVFKQAFIYEFCKADLNMIFIRTRKKKFF
jgi:hypothetical protein